MTLRFLKGVFIAVLVLGVSGAYAQTDMDELEERERREAEMQAAFAAQMTEVVADLNEGSFRDLSQAIDRDDFIERIFNLRLIDPKIRRDFRDQMKKEPQQFEDFIASLFSVETKDGYSAKLLLVESRGDRGRAVVRFDLPYFQVNYQDYDLRLRGNDKLVVVDWKDYLWGYDATDRVALQLISLWLLPGRAPNRVSEYIWLCLLL